MDRCGMIMFSILLSIWYDEHWTMNFKKSWRKLGYWIGFKKESPGRRFIGLTFEVACLDFKLVLRGKNG